MIAAVRLLDSPVGPITVGAMPEGVYRLDLGDAGTPQCRLPEEDGAGRATAAAEILERACAQVLEYFGGTRRDFDAPLYVPQGAPFQQAVWEAVRRIPYGETRTYGDIARETGRPKAARAVGASLHWNPVALIIPCHRVIGKDGSLCGFGSGVDIKAYLLAFERERKHPTAGA